MQKRNWGVNVRLIFFPAFFCALIVLIQAILNNEIDKPENKCGCTCVPTNQNGQCERRCGIEYSTPDQVATCPIPSPPQWPPILQVPAPQYRAVRTNISPNAGLPNETCRSTGSCPATILLTGNDQSFGESMLIFLSSLNIFRYLVVALYTIFWGILILFFTFIVLGQNLLKRFFIGNSTSILQDLPYNVLVSAPSLR